MHTWSQPSPVRLAALLIGCVLAASPQVSTCAQVVGAKVPVAAASSTDSELGAQFVRDRWDASKGDTAAANDNRSTVTAPSAAPDGSPEFAQLYISQKLELWQERLKLSDWRITWAMAHRSDLKPNTVGQIHWDKPSRCASILVLDSSDYRMPFNAMLDDIELTIIHELVHLKLTSLPHSEASRGSEEQAVNGISEALFALEHQKK
jgi:hypothetical protein